MREWTATFVIDGDEYEPLMDAFAELMNSLKSESVLFDSCGDMILAKSRDAEVA
jgi:hypothetical protein